MKQKRNKVRAPLRAAIFEGRRADDFGVERSSSFLFSSQPRSSSFLVKMAASFLFVLFHLCIIWVTCLVAAATFARFLLSSEARTEATFFFFFVSCSWLSEAYFKHAKISDCQNTWTPNWVQPKEKLTKIITIRKSTIKFIKKK